MSFLSIAPYAVEKINHDSVELLFLSALCAGDTKKRLRFLRTSSNLGNLPSLTLHMAVLVGTALVSHEKRPPSQYAPLEQTTLFVASDLHYLSPELTDNGEYFNNLIKNGDGKAMGFCEDITDAFIRQVIGQKPDVLILCPGI